MLRQRKSKSFDEHPRNPETVQEFRYGTGKARVWLPSPDFGKLAIWAKTVLVSLSVIRALSFNRIVTGRPDLSWVNIRRPGNGFFSATWSGITSVSGPRLRLLVSGVSDKTPDDVCQNLGDHVEFLAAGDQATSPAEIDAVLFAGDFVRRSRDLQVCALGFLDSVPDGLALVDDCGSVVWHNHVFQDMTCRTESFYGDSFIDVLGVTQDAPASAGLSAVLNEGGQTRFTVRLADRDLELSATRAELPTSSGEIRQFVSVAVRDVTEQVRVRQKLEAIHRAGMQLRDLRPDEVAVMNAEDRIELLKEHILQFSEEILGFDRIEIRLLDPETLELIPLVQEGMQDDAASRSLFAREYGNGLTGYVAATGQSYLCRDTQTEPRYLRGAEDARSSITVPLRLQDVILGTFNVEGPGADSFDEKDVDFLEHFGEVVAQAINQLQLMMAEKVSTAEENAQRMQQEIARPTDDILADTTAILEKYIGHDPDVCEKLQRIQASVRSIRGSIGQVSDAFTATPAYPHCRNSRPQRPELLGKRILVVDSDDTVRQDAHNLLDPLGCNVETVGSGAQACQMMRSHNYDVVLADIRLPDMTGFECFSALRQIDNHTPVIFMTGFGWDASHSIVKARQEGLKSVLYKPFRVEQLLNEVEQAVRVPPPIE